MRGERIPMVILGGSDRRAVQMPESGRDKHPLTGYKGVDILIGGRPLVELLVESLRDSGRFEPVYVAGPSSAYRDLQIDAAVIETDGSFGQNIRASVELVRRRHAGSSMGFLTCDVLPDARTLTRLMEDYDRDAPCDVWFPLVRVPLDRGALGPSAWKPTYRIVPRAGEAPVELLPGHLMVVDPGALRLRFLYRLFQIGYRTRNRPIAHRRSVMVREMLQAMLYQDLLHLAGLRWPTLTWTVLSAAIPTARALRAGTATRDELESSVRRVFARYRHRRQYPQRRVVLPFVDALPLALDIDTEEEARAQGAHLALHEQRAEGNGVEC